LTRDIGDELNISSMLELSPVEQAKNDLNRVEFDALQFDEDGEITNESLSQFIAAQPVEERTKLIDRGLPTKQARQRLENAIFARAYADDDLIAMFAQTEDVEARLVINALAQVAPQMAQLEGAGDLDIRDIVTDAAKIIVSGKRRGLKLKEISSQVDMTVDPDTKIPEELAELQRKELSGEAEAERDRLEAEEAARAAEIAAKKVAEQKGEQPGDLAPTTGKMELSAPPITDLFGTQGITDQPVRGPRRVAAEPSPIEKLAAKEPTVDEAIEEELKKAGYDDLGKMSKNIQDEFGVGKPVADAYARAVQNARIQVVRSQFGLVTESQLREALNEQTKLRNRIDGIVKRKEPKKEPEAEKKPSIRKTREVAEGTVVERIELPDNIEIRIVKLKDGYSVYQYDLDADQIVMGQQRQFRSPAFPKDQDAYQAAEAFASDMFDKVVPKMADEMQAAMKERLSRGEDVINNKTPDPDIPADQRLVLMACCATKKKGMGMGPAIEVYTGVFFQTLKNKLKEGAMPNLRILSAKYGFIAPDQKIEVYDQVMDKSSADGFMLDDKLVEGFPSNIKDVLIVGSDQYQRVMKAAIEDLIKAGKIDKGASINVTKGGIGEQRAQLGKYLASLPAKKEPEGKKAAKTPLAFYQQMIPDAGFKRLDLDDPRTYKNKSGEEFLTFERDGVRVAVKSNTQLYAADRGVGMYMGEDNDLLIQAMIVDESARRQGKATKALQDILSMADQAGMTSYIEPVQMTKDVGMTTEQLKDFYKRFGFKPQKTEPVTDRVMVREPGAKIEVKKEEKPKDGEADMEFMLKGTEDQQKGVRAVARQVGGQPVYFDPETNIGLVRGYGEEAGTPIYAVTMGNRYSENDVEVTTATPFLPYKAKLIEIKNQLEKEAEQKHKDDPFITFENGIAMSSDIDQSTGEIFKEWKSMLGLGNVNIYLSTFEDAKKNVDNFTGPHRVIGSGLLKSLTGGRMRRMPDGSYFILFEKSTSKTAVLEMLAHELGHVHEREAYNNAPQELKDKLKEAYEKWVTQRQGKTAREAIEMLRAKTTAQTTKIGADITTVRELDRADPRRYWSSFSEWYADQVSRWAVTDEKPVGVVEKFFARLGAALRRFYQTLKGQKFLPDETFVQYLKQVKPVIVEEIPGPVKEPVQIEMTFQMLKDLFGSEKEAVDIKRIMEVYPPKKKLPPKRSPELAAAAAALNAGELTAAEYDALVNIYRPIPYYFEPLKPATEEQVIGALDVSKKPKANPVIQNGHRVGLRLDIPAFDRHGVFVVSIHQKRKPSSTGEIIGYASVAKAKNVTFGIGNELKALDIAMGKGKDALQTMEGEYVNITPEQAFAEAQRAIKDPSYVQVGFDPARHSYFFDRRTTLPVVSAEEVLQIGNMILAKKPVFRQQAKLPLQH
jgi:GNAT superfamily N-acetyltransferase